MKQKLILTLISKTYSIRTTQIGLGMLPHTSAEMEGPGHSCHFVVYNQTGSGAAHSGLLPTRKRISGNTVPGLGVES